MLVIDGSELGNRLDGTNILEQQLRTAKCVVLDDINAHCNHANYAKLLEDSGYFLVDCDLNRRNGYAIFEGACCENGDVEECIDSEDGHAADRCVDLIRMAPELMSTKGD